MRKDWNGVLTCVCGQALSPKSSLHKDVTAATADRTVSARLKRKLTELEELWEFDLNWLHNVICLQHSVFAFRCLTHSPFNAMMSVIRRQEPAGSLRNALKAEASEVSATAKHHKSMSQDVFESHVPFLETPPIAHAMSTVLDSSELTPSPVGMQTASWHTFSLVCIKIYVYFLVSNTSPFDVEFETRCICL